ncbi:PCYCGC domain-containing protein [Anoxybacillus salavatliensis]|uniref:PCYCGC domain-containing protein n=1 Tax=Anoxybacillus gonensis TaxID=198467 RepID=UPI00214BCDCF|nr:PCYCGC domain-containing protein [Anoxybacillus gonensis]MCQ5365699.1 PCYCGC domain-containing protein [Anoxybacillus gonensis]
MRKRFMFSSILSVSLLFSGCAQKENDHVAEHQTGDIREETASVHELPSFLASYNESMVHLYEQVAAHRALLENIPCYCGCGESAGHENNYDCFVYENKSNGAIVWDDHATKCGVCLEIASISIEQYEKGMSIKDIRHFIDETYKEGYAKPTPTKPM